MTTTHITGDRRSSLAYLPLVAVEMMRALAAGDTIRTGDTGKGVDLLVTEFAREAGVTVHVVSDDACEVNADTRIVYVHVDPHSSSRVKQFLSLPDDMMRLVTA